MVMINGKEYVEATKEDFEIIRSGGNNRSKDTLKYVGDKKYVILPDYVTLSQLMGRTRNYMKSYANMFAGTDIKGVASVGPTGADSMMRMFQDTTSAEIDISGLNTSGVTHMGGMFENSQALRIHTNKMHTGLVTSMASMFKGTKVEYLDLRNFNTSKVENMSHMFEGTEARIINTTSFDTSNVTDMSYMFKDTKAKKIDVLNFDTSKVSDYQYMFENSQAETLDMRSFSGGTSRGMFKNAAATKIENLNSFEIPYSHSLIRNRRPWRIDEMFMGTSVEVLDLSANPARNSGFLVAFVDGKGMFEESSVSTVYIQDDRKTINWYRGRKAGDITEVGGKGYIEPYVRPPITPTEPDPDDIMEIVEEPLEAEVMEFKQVRIPERTWKEGKEEVVQEGEDGIRRRRYATIHYMDGRKVRVLQFQEIIPAIVETTKFGTIVSEKTEKDDEEYEFLTIKYNDYELRYPQEKVMQRGEEGYRKRTYNVITHSDGKVDRTLEDEETKDPVREIIAIGMIDRTSSQTKETILPFETVTEYDYELNHNDGEPHVIERGKEGKIRETYEVTVYVDGTEDLWELHPEKTVTTEPVTQVQKIGLIDRIVKEEDEKVIEFDVVFEYSMDLLEGEEDLRQQGVNGREFRNYEVTYYVEHPSSGRTREPDKVEIKEDYEYEAPINHIIEIGTQAAVKSVKDDIIEKVVRFETEYRDDPTLYKGQEVTLREGKNGGTTEKYQIITFFDGTVQRHHVFTNETPAISKIIRRGTKDPVISRRVTQEERELPFETAYIKTNDLADGVEETLREGQDGKVVLTYEALEYYDGRNERQLINEERIEPVNKIVKVGTDEIILDQKELTEREVVNFETVYKDDATLYEGQQRIDKAGKDGLIERVYVVTIFENGTEEKVLIDTKRTDAVTQVIKVGTMKEGSGERELINEKNYNSNHTGGFLYLEDGDRTIRSTVKTKIRPIWGYL